MIWISKYKVFDRIKSYVKANYKKLDINDFVLGDAPFNRKCHLNSVQSVKQNKTNKVYSCFAVDTTDNSHCVHFINGLENGKYQDNTWGWTYEKCEYYLIKEISTDEQEHIWDSLKETKEMLLYTNSNCFERFIYQLNYRNSV